MGSKSQGKYSKQVTYNTVGSITTLFCQWLIIMIIPKITDFSEAGIFSVAISVTSILNLLATLSLKEFQVSDQNIRFSDSDYKHVRAITIALSFIGIIPFVILFDYGLTECTAIISYLIYRSLLHYGYIYSASLQVHGHLDVVGKHTAIEGVFSFTSFTAAYLLSHNLLLSILVMAAIGGGSFLILEYRYYIEHVEKTNRPFNREKTRQLLLIGIPLFLSILAPALTTALPKLFVQYEWGDAMAGIFNTLAAPTVIIPTLAIAIFAAFIPYFSQLARSGDMATIRRKYLLITCALLLFGLLCTMASFVLQTTVFVALYGDEMEVASEFFAYLVAGITFYSVGITGTTVLITKDQGKLAAPLASVSLVVSIISCMVLIPSMGIEGAAYSMFLAYLTFGLLISLCVYYAPLKKTATA